MIHVLVIMPVLADPNACVKREALLELLGNEAILPPTTDSGVVPPFEATEMLEVLRNVDWVIADLSFERPSCYFELGMAQAVAPRCSLIAERGTTIHQHSGTVSFYAGLEEYRQLIHRLYLSTKDSAAASIAIPK